MQQMTSSFVHKDGSSHIISVHVPVYLLEYLQTDRERKGDSLYTSVAAFFLFITLVKVLGCQQFCRRYFSLVLRSSCALSFTQENNLTRIIRQRGAI